MVEWMSCLQFFYKIPFDTWGRGKGRYVCCIVVFNRPNVNNMCVHCSLFRRCQLWLQCCGSRRVHWRPGMKRLLRMEMVWWWLVLSLIFKTKVLMLLTWRQSVLMPLDYLLERKIFKEVDVGETKRKEMLPVILQSTRRRRDSTIKLCESAGGKKAKSGERIVVSLLMLCWRLALFAFELCAV